MRKIRKGELVQFKRERWLRIGIINDWCGVVYSETCINYAIHNERKVVRAIPIFGDNVLLWEESLKLIGEREVDKVVGDR